LAEYCFRFWQVITSVVGRLSLFTFGDHEVAIEVKATSQANNRHLKGLISFAEEYAVKDFILVTNDPARRRMGNCNVLPWKVFLEKLWAGEIIG
jgi:uncharacterized protein